MAINPLAIPSYGPALDITGDLANLTKTLNEGQKRQTLADLGKGLADGTLDYKQAAAKAATLGDLGSTMSLLKLGQEQEASKAFGNSLSSLYGFPAQSAPSLRQSSAGPVIPNDSNAFPGQAGMDARLADASQDFIQDNPSTYLSSGVRSTADQARLYADRANNSNPVAAPGTSRHERGLAIDIGGMTPEQRAMLPQYGLAQPVANDPPHVELADTRLASNDPAALPANAQATQGYAIPGQSSEPGGISPRAIQLIRAMSIPGISATQKEIGGKLLAAELDQSKLPDQVKQYVYAKAQDPNIGSFTDWTRANKAAGKTEVNITQTGEKEYEKQNAKDMAEMNRKLIEGAQSARMKLGTLTRMDQLLSDPKIYTGAGGEQVLTAKKLAKAAGFDVGDVSGPEAIRAIGNQFALELRNPAGGAGMPGAMSDKDREFLQASVPGLTQTPEGNRKIVDYMKRVAQRSLDVERLRQDYVKKNGRLNEGFYRELDAYSSAHPLFPEAEQPAQSAPPMQGARQAPDGNWYVQQNGKYFRVDQ
jgi:hypothetical protein